MSKPPWQKDQFKDITRYDWLTAVGLSDVHCDRPRDLRIANCLMQHMNAETGLAFPNQSTLALWGRCSTERQVYGTLVSLEGSGAINRKRFGDLQPDTAEIVRKIGGRNGRASVYRLNLFWAYELFESYRHVIKTPKPESNKSIAARLQHRSTTDRYDRSESDRYKPVYDRPTNTIGDTVVSLGEESHEGRDVLPTQGYVSEEGLDPLVLVPPDDPFEARRWLAAICTDRSKIAWALELYADDKLTPEIIRELAA